jgi:predicted methyltransferase
MRIVSIVLITTSLWLSSFQNSYASNETDISAALASPARTQADRERDEREKPQQVLELTGFKKGMVIADVFGGGGYYSEILSGVVGKNGNVLMINNAPYDAYSKKDLSVRLANNRLSNVQYSIVPNENLGLAANSLDGALIIMSYHDLFYADPEGGWPAIDAKQFIDQIVKALKSGGKFLIVDHSAKADSGIADTKTLHRIDEQFTIAELKSHGLQWVGSIDVLRNAEDDHSKAVFDPAIKGRTDRFVHIYQKPAQ